MLDKDNGIREKAGDGAIIHRLSQLTTRNLRIALNQAKVMKPEVVAAYLAVLSRRGVR